MNTESRAWSLCARKLRLPIFPIPIIPFTTRRGGIRPGELGRFGGTIGGATFLGNRGGLFLERAGIPLATGGCEGSFFSKVRAERPDDGTERVAGDAGMATGARLAAEGGSRPFKAELVSKGSVRGNMRGTLESNEGGNATLWVA